METWRGVLLKSQGHISVGTSSLKHPEHDGSGGWLSQENVGNDPLCHDVVCAIQASAWTATIALWYYSTPLQWDE